MIKLVSRMRNWKFHQATWVNCTSVFVQFLNQCTTTTYYAHRHVHIIFRCNYRFANPHWELHPHISPFNYIINCSSKFIFFLFRIPIFYKLCVKTDICKLKTNLQIAIYIRKLIYNNLSYLIYNFYL